MHKRHSMNSISNSSYTYASLCHQFTLISHINAGASYRPNAGNYLATVASVFTEFTISISNYVNHNFDDSFAFVRISIYSVLAAASTKALSTALGATFGATLGFLNKVYCNLPVAQTIFNQLQLSNFVSSE